MRLLVCALTSMMMMSCSPASKKASGESIQFDNKEAAITAYEDWSVQCLDAGACPENVGQLVVKTADPTTVDVCTAFLVDSQTIVTNSHCVTELVENADCTATAQVVFPQTATAPRDVAICGRLQQDSHKKSEDDADLAIIHLNAPSARKPLAFDNSGLQDQEKLTIFKVNPSTGAEPNYLAKQSCRVVTQPFFLAQFSGGSDATVSFTDCEIIHGNSGSPLIGASGGVKAVTFGFSTPVEPIPELDHKFFNLATNATCLQLSPLSIAPAGCAVDVTARQAARLQVRQTELNAAIDKARLEFGEWASAHADTTVLWTSLESIDGRVRVSGKPFCVQPSKQGTASVVFADVPVFEIVSKYDSSYREVNETQKTVTAETLSLSMVQSCGRELTTADITNMYGTTK